MFPRRPGRIRDFSYSGFHRYSLTICTKLRQPLFCDAEVVESVLSRLLQCAKEFDFAILAYCFMPDHLHLIVAGCNELADLRGFVTRFKQFAGYDYRQRTHQYLWQESYYDHVLRSDEATERHIRYVMENPVRKGLVGQFTEYPFTASDVFSTEELWDLWREKG
jgi:putative transposase